MSDFLNDGGPAFPIAIMARQADGQPLTGFDFGVQGMTLRQYAAIHLCVPNSGTDWLDEMIINSLRDKIAAQVLANLKTYNQPIDAARWAYDSASAALSTTPSIG